MTILCDSREHKYIIERMITLGAKIDALSFGDYVIEGAKRKIVIERKEIGDLFNSVLDGRLWEQLKGMEKYGRDWEKIVVIEGDFRGWSDWQEQNRETLLNRITGIKTSIVFGWPGTSIVMTSGMSETVDFISSLNKKVGEVDGGIGFQFMGIASSVRTGNEEMLDTICSITGIEKSFGIKLFEEFRSISNITRADRDELIEVIGEKEGTHLYEIVRNRWRKK